MQPVRIETIVDERGEVHLGKLPFRAGESVEVIVRSRPKRVSAASEFPLRGTPVEYREPTEPVAADDWDALR